MSILHRLNQIEPARLRAIWIAVVALLATAGVSVSADLDAKVTAVIGVLAVLLPLLQGESTRAAVYAPATVEQIRDEPGEGDY
jgi:Mg/Co/Ni transporter MgtE